MTFRQPAIIPLLILGALAGCTSEPPGPALSPEPPPSLGDTLTFQFPASGGNATHALRVLPTAQRGLERVYLSGGSAAEVVVLDPTSLGFGSGQAPGSSYAVAAIRQAGVGLVFVETDPGAVVRIVQEQGFQFTLREDRWPGYQVGNAVLHRDAAYVLLVDPDGLESHQLLRVAGGVVTEVELDALADRGLDGPSLGSDGVTLALCQQSVAALEAVILDEDGGHVQTHMLDATAALGASPCVAAQADGFHAFAWQAADGQAMLARLQDGQVSTEAFAQGVRPEGVWTLGNRTALLATDPEGWTDLWIPSSQGWRACRIQADVRDEVMVYQTDEALWAFTRPYHDDASRQELRGQKLADGSCPSALA